MGTQTTENGGMNVKPDVGFTFRSTNAYGTAGDHLLRIENNTIGVWKTSDTFSGTNLAGQLIAGDNTDSLTSRSGIYTYTKGAEKTYGYINTQYRVFTGLSYRFSFNVNANVHTSISVILENELIFYLPPMGTGYITYNYNFIPRKTGTLSIKVDPEVLEKRSILYKHFSIDPLYQTTVDKSLNVKGHALIGTAPIASTSFAMQVVGNTDYGLAIAPKEVRGSVVSQKGNIAMYGSFDHSSDTFPRRCADIYAGYKGGDWGYEYLSFGVGDKTKNGNPTAERMRIQANGHVGIETDNPQYTLDVNGVLRTTSGTVISSDRRIKNNIVDVEDDRALRDLRRLKPKTYTYRDKRGTEPVYGFIAQDVKEVLNYSTLLSNDTVPNIYEMSTFVEDILTLTFNTTDLSRDASGDLFTKLKVTREGKDEYVNIVEVIDEHTVRVDKDLGEQGKIFVYGQEVNDFHVLNKDAIWTVSTAALQEVDRQLQAEKQKVRVLQEAITSLLVRVDALEQKPVGPKPRLRKRDKLVV
jgi:hypothetical protein